MSTMDIHDYGIYLCVSDPQCFRRWMPSTIPVLPQWVWLDSSVPGTSPSISSHSRLPLQLQLGVRWFANLVRWPLSLPTCWQRSWMKQVSGRWVASSTQDFALILHCRKEFFTYTPRIYFLTSKWKPTQMSTSFYGCTFFVTVFWFPLVPLFPDLPCFTLPVYKMGKAYKWGDLQPT